MSSSDLGFSPDDGSALNPEALLQHIGNDSKLMDQLSQTDPEFEQVVRQKDINSLQGLLKKRHRRCHCRSSTRFILLLEHFRKKYEPSYVEGQAKKEHAIFLKASPEFTPMYGHSRKSFEKEVLFYVDIEVNGFPLKAVIRTGSYSTVISKSCAKRCRLLADVDARCESINQFIKMGSNSYCCLLLVSDSCDTEFILGLDILHKLECVIDFKDRILKVGDDIVKILSDKDFPSILDKETYAELVSSLRTKPLNNEMDNGMEDSSAAVSGNELIFSGDGSITNPKAFFQRIRADSELMARIFQIPQLAKIVLVNAHEKRKDVLQDIRCRCQHCISHFLRQYFEPLKRFDVNRAIARQHLQVNSASLDMPYVDVKVGYGFPSKAIVDSGALFSVMSKGIAKQSGMLPHVNACFESIDDRGRSKILGRLNHSFVKIGKEFYRCHMYIMDSTDIEVVLGVNALLMLKCILDLKENVLKVFDDEVSIVLQKDFPSIRDEDWCLSSRTAEADPKDELEAKIDTIMSFQYESKQAEEALDECDGNVRRAVRVLFCRS